MTEPAPLAVFAAKIPPDVSKLRDSEKDKLLKALDAISFPSSIEEGKKEYKKHAPLVHKHFRAFIEVGARLKLIKDHALYLPQFAGKEGADDFRTYADKLFNSHQRAYQILQAAETRRILMEVLKISDADQLWAYESHYASIAAKVKHLASGAEPTENGKSVIALLESQDKTLSDVDKREAIEAAISSVLEGDDKDITPEAKRKAAIGKLLKSVPALIQNAVSRVVDDLDDGTLTEKEQSEISGVLKDALAKLKFVSSESIAEERKRKKAKPKEDEKAGKLTAKRGKKDVISAATDFTAKKAAQKAIAKAKAKEKTPATAKT